jgi:hypothetical protein
MRQTDQDQIVQAGGAAVGDRHDMVVVADVDGLAACGEAAAAIPRDQRGPQGGRDFGFGGGGAEGDGAVDQEVAQGRVAGEALRCGGGELDRPAGGSGEELARLPISETTSPY